MNSLFREYLQRNAAAQQKAAWSTHPDHRVAEKVVVWDAPDLRLKLTFEIC